MSGIAGPSRSQLNSVYAGVNEPGNRIVFLGDSTTLASDVPATNSRSISWPNYTAHLSNQQAYYVRNAGLSGDTAATANARFATDVTPYRPTLVTILLGRNDIGTAVSLATYQTNIQAIVAKIRAIGAQPVICTITPTNSTGGITTTKWNSWLRVYAASIGAPILDFYNILVDPATGSFLSGYDAGDHIHPNAAGYFAMGQHAATVLSTYLPPYYPPVANDGADTSNLVGSNCCFTNTTLNGNGEPSGFFVLNPANTTNSVDTTDTTIKGNWLKMTVSAAATSVELYKTGYAVTVGRTYIFAAKVKTALSAGNFTANITFAGGSQSGYAVFQDTNNLNGFVYWVGTAPTGSTSLQIHFTLASGSTGYAQVAQVSLYDATALSLSTLLP